MKYKKVCQVEIFLMLIILLSSFAFAFGIGCQSTAFEIYPGETKTAYFYLQSEPGTENMSVKIEMIAGQDIASLPPGDNIYTVASAVKTEIPVKITIPKNTSVGWKEKVALSASTITPGTGSAIAMGQVINNAITVLVVSGETPQAKGIPAIYWIILGIILIIIIIIILLKRKKSQL
jgi:hypothetical protein